MTRRGAWARALAASLAVLLLGAAFLHQGMRGREAEARLAAAHLAERVGLALEREGREAFGQLERAAERGPGAALHAQLLGNFDSLLRVSGGRIESRVPANGALVDPLDLAAAAGARALLGPLRDASGTHKLAARLTVPGDPPHQLAGVLDLRRVLAAAHVPALAGAGFDHALVAEGVRERVVSRSADGPLARPVVRPVAFGEGAWRLELAPREGWRPWPPLALHAIIVLVASLAAGLLAFESAKHRLMLARDVAERDERLRESTRALLEEAQQREALEKQFSHASFHDALTGLGNGRFLLKRLGNLLREIRTGEQLPLELAALELGQLDAVGASLGQAVADGVLREAAARLEREAHGRRICRLRDAAFAVVIGDIGEDGEPARELAERLQRALSEPFAVGGHAVYATVRAGLAAARSGYDHPEDVVRRAELALARARLTQAAVVAFDATAQEQMVSRQQLETDLHGVAERGELRVLYQPIVSLTRGDIVGFEALIRWQHPVEGMVPPGVFIPIAEQTGLIVPITRWVMREACRQAVAWNAARATPLYVSVNLSAHDMRLADMGDYVQDVIAETGAGAAMLRLEVTEGSMIDNLRAAIDLIARFRAMGVKVLLDDFGTGYSSLSYLNQFQVDFLKIDQSFVRNLSPDPRSSGIVRAILSLCEGMGIRTVAEGIETAEAMAQLAGLRCDYGQGYHFSRPLPPDFATRLLDSGKRWDPHAAAPQAAAAD